MTPTQALIEAAEDYMNGSDNGLTFSERVERRRLMYDAISSAKAAEEGVETSYEVQFLAKSGDWITDYPGMSLEEAQDRAKAMSYRWKCRVVEKKTYTTVIEVREKEEKQ